MMLIKEALICNTDADNLKMESEAIVALMSLDADTCSRVSPDHLPSTIKLTDETLSRLAHLLKSGCSIQLACDEIGVSRTSFYRWVDRARAEDAPSIYYEFAAVLAQTRAQRSKQVFECILTRIFYQFASALGQHIASQEINSGFASSEQNHTAAPSEVVENPVPRITCASFVYLPKRYRQRFLKMIHTFTKEVLIREKVWSKMNDYERELLKIIAKEICMQPTLISEPLTFDWNGVLVTRTFQTYEFLEPVAMNLIIRYLHDQNRRNLRAEKRSSSSGSADDNGSPK